jgi:sugar-specific transcriptional regulator TrmB
MKTDILEKIGLNKNESYIYNILLTNGEMSAPDIAEKARLKLTRQNTYMVLKGLVKRGLVEELDKRKKLTYRLEHPQKLLDFLEEEKKALEENEKMVESVLPEIISDYNLAHNKPGIAYYEGTQGIRKIFEMLYKEKDEPVLGCVDLEELAKSFPDLTKIIIPSRKRNMVESITLFADSTKAREHHKKDKEEMRISALLDKKKYPIPAEIDVFEDKIAMLDFSKGKFIGVVIENKDMATSLKSLMRLALENKGIKIK